jgi:hypothetical protein
MYTDLLKICGYEDGELEKERPRIDKAFDILGIGREDISRAETRVYENFDVSLEGVRKLLHIWMNELVTLPLCRDEYKKVIYGDWPFPSAMMCSTHRLSEDVYMGAIGEVMSVGMGMIFDKLSPLLETGEKTGLGVGAAHCALWQTHVGAIVKGLIPLPDLMVSSGYYCDQAAEADQLLAELYGIPTVYMDGCTDGQWGHWPGDIDERIIRYTASQMEKVFQKVEEVTGYTFTEEIRKSGARDNAKFFYNFTTLVETVGKSDPQVISQANVNLAFWLVNTPIRRRNEANDAVTTLIRETRERMEHGAGVVEKGAPKIYFGLRQAVDASILKMVENLGLSMALVYVDWLTPPERTKAKSTDLNQRIMEGWFRRGVHCIQGAQGAIDYFTYYCREWNVDGAILCHAYSCRPHCIPLLMEKKEIKERLAIPVLVLEGDSYDTRNYSAGQLRTRIETFAELLKSG